MSQDDPFEAWKTEHASAIPSEGFADRVMAAVREHAAERPSPVARRWLGVGGGRRAVSPWGVAASVCAALACHGAVVGAIWLAWAGVAQ